MVAQTQAEVQNPLHPGVERKEKKIRVLPDSVQRPQDNTGRPKLGNKAKCHWQWPTQCFVWRAEEWWGAMRILPEQVSSKNNYHSHTQEPEKKDAVSVRVIAREDKERSQRESGKYFCTSSTHSFHSKFQCQLPQISCSLSDKIYLKHHRAYSLQFLTAPTQTYLVHVYQLSH